MQRCEPNGRQTCKRNSCASPGPMPCPIAHSHQPRYQCPLRQLTTRRTRVAARRYYSLDQNGALARVCPLAMYIYSRRDLCIGHVHLLLCVMYWPCTCILCADTSTRTLSHIPPKRTDQGSEFARLSCGVCTANGVPSSPFTPSSIRPTINRRPRINFMWEDVSVRLSAPSKAADCERVRDCAAELASVRRNDERNEPTPDLSRSGSIIIISHQPTRHLRNSRPRALACAIATAVWIAADPSVRRRRGDVHVIGPTFGADGRSCLRFRTQYYCKQRAPLFVR